MAAPRSSAASWLSSRRHAWLRAPALGAAALGAGTSGVGALGGGGAENGNLNCAIAGAAQRTRTGRAAPAVRKTVVIAVPIMEPGPTPPMNDGSAAMVTKVWKLRGLRRNPQHKSAVADARLYANSR